MLTVAHGIMGVAPAVTYGPALDGSALVLGLAAPVLIAALVGGCVTLLRSAREARRAMAVQRSSHLPVAEAAF